MNALIVAVNYNSELAVTLPHNAEHFEHVLIVTDMHDPLLGIDADGNEDWAVYRTDAFYADPHSPFRKDYAVFKGLRHFGPRGWTMLLDADVLLPENVTFDGFEVGNLYAPRRRIHPRGELKTNSKDWGNFPIQPDTVFAGYCQIFHSSDPNVQPWPNYPIENPCWFSDTVFQDRWPPAKRIRTSWDVLHIGDPPGVNWYGRTPEARQALRDARRANKRPWKSQW